MTPAEPAHLEHATPADDAVPDYVLDLERAADYLTAEQRALLRRAWAVGAAAHAGQLRKSGEPYITHPVAVVTGPGTVPVAFADGVHHVLPEAAADWVDELDLRSIIHLRDAEPVMQALLLDLPQRNRTMANG